MNIQPYFADEELREVEKAVYEITELHNNQILNTEYLLEKLFEKGFTFERFSKNKIRTIILRFIKNWAKYEIERLKSEHTSDDPKIRIRIENLQLLQGYLKLASKKWYLFNESITLATKIIKEQKLKNFIGVIYEAMFYPTLEKLKSRRHWSQIIFKDWDEKHESTEVFTEIREQTPEKGSYEEFPKDSHEESYKKSHEESNENPYEPSPLPEEIEEDTQLSEESPYLKFLRILYYIIDQYEEFPKEVIKSLCDKGEINFEEMTVKQLISSLYAIAEYEVEHKLTEDEYMGDRFRYGDLEELLAQCDDLENIESKDCQLARLLYLWMFIEESESYYDYKLFESFESMINFTDAEKNLIELIKEQLSIKQKKEREKLALIRKKMKKKRRTSKKLCS